MQTFVNEPGDSPLVPYPNLFIVGAPRCGTTAMFDYLAAHPQIVMSSYKEPHFFGSDLVGLQFEIFRGNEKKYLDLFKPSDEAAYYGEASIYYLFSENAAREIHAFNPDARIVIMLRSPLEVLKSLYIHVSLADIQYNSLDEAVMTPATAEDGTAMPPSRKRFLNGPGVCYYEQVKRFIDVFGREQVHVIVYDDFKADTPLAYRRLLEFLAVDSTFQPKFNIVNASKEARSNLLRQIMNQSFLTKLGARVPKLALPVYRALKVLNSKSVEQSAANEFSPATRQHLNALLQPDLERLGSLLGRDFSHWLEYE